MNWILQNQFFILGGLLAAGFFILGTILARVNKKVKVIFGGQDIKEENFKQDLIRRLTKTEIKLEELEPRLKIVEAISEMSIQKVGFIRFNPFSDTGGDNSFIVSLLDRKNNGVLISSLYTREGVRVYAKNIEGGKSKHPLSGEEKSVMEETIRK